MVSKLSELEKLTKDTELLNNILEYLQQRKRLEIMLFLHDHGVTRWGDVKKQPQLGMTDNTFRTAVKELVKLGLAEAIPIDPLKNKWCLTDFGCLIADIIKRAVRDISILIQAKRGQ